MEYRFEQWDRDLKYFLGWYADACANYASNPSKKNSMDNARMAILNHCARLKNRCERLENGIL